MIYMNDSIWKNFNECGQKVTADMEVDTLVIGGGLCGVLCAYYLKEAGKEVILVEADIYLSKEVIMISY